MAFVPKVRSWVARVVLVAFPVAIVLFTCWMAVRSDKTMREDLLQQVRILAKAVNADHVKTLAGSEADLDTPNYLEVKKQLLAVRSANPHCRFLYLTGRKADGTVFFFADSEPTDSEDYSPPGQVYKEASATFRGVLDSGIGVTEGPVTDRWGTWVSALTPVTDPETGAVLGVLGMDVDGRSWHWLIFKHTAPMTGLFLAVSVIVFVFQRSNAKVRTEHEKLKQSELHLETILESSADGMLAVGQDGKVIKYNHRFQELWQIPDSLMQTASHEDLLRFIMDQLPDPALAPKKFEAFLEQGVPASDIVCCINGRIIEGFFNPMMLDGKVAGRLWVFHDITKRRQAEESLLRLATAVEQSAESIIITDLEGRIYYTNPAAEQSSGYSRTELMGQSFRILKSEKQDGAVYEQMLQAMVRGEVWTGHLISQRKDRSYYEEDAVISPVRDATGVIVNYVAVKRDVTREVQLRAQLRQAQKMEAIGQLAGGVAHDFNNILTSLQIQTGLLSETEGVPEGIRDGLAQIRADADRAASLTRQLLLFSRRQIMQPQVLDLNETVRNLDKMLRRIIGEHIQIQLNLHSQPLLTRADAGMLEQVLMNLAVNARDAMPQGGCLSVQTFERTLVERHENSQGAAAPGRYVCLRVSDTGNGIAPEALTRIFEPFFTTKEAGKGTGLGLATVFGIVQQHKGWIEVDNRPGQGVSFSVHLPASEASKVESPHLAALTQQGNGSETILVVEDETILRSLTCRILKRSGYQVIEASNGQEALRLWSEKAGSIALLLTDLVMPGGLGGQELAARLQKENLKLKVLFVSGYSAQMVGREFVPKAGERFLSKPYAPVELLKVLRECLDAEEPANQIQAGR